MGKHEVHDQDKPSDQQAPHIEHLRDIFDHKNVPMPTTDQLAGYRAGSFNDKACGIERGDGAARSSLISSVGEAKSQDLLDRSLQKLEDSGSAKVVRDQNGDAKEIIIHPHCGSPDKGATTKVEIGTDGEVKVDGRDAKAAAAESTDFARQYSDGMLDNGFLRKGEKPLSAEQKEQARAFNHAVLDGDPQKLSEAVKTMLKDPESARRIINEHGKSFGVYGAQMTKGDNPSVVVGDYNSRTTIDKNGEMKTIDGFDEKKQMSPADTQKSLEKFAQTAARSIADSADLHNEFDEKTKGKVTTPQERSKNFSTSLQNMIDWQDKHK